LATALILVPLLALVVADYRFSTGAPGSLLVPMALLFALLGSAELLAMLRGRGYRPVGWSVYAGVAMIVLAACAPLAWNWSGVAYPVGCPLGKPGWPLAAAAFAVGLAFVAEMRRYREPGGALVNLALAVLTIVYLGLAFAFLVELRLFHSHAWGMAALVSLLVVAKLSDTGAYTAGKLFGQRKLAPLLSPGKTMEGTLGGVVTAGLVSWLYFRFLTPLLFGLSSTSTPWWGAVLYGFIVAVTGLVGDLSESLLKRELSCKDSSRWLPGLGGILDVLDSVLFAAPPAYLCWAAGLVGPL